MITLIESHLPSIKVCKFYNLLDYDFNMDLLFDDLQLFLNEKFPNKDIEFQDNERIVFLHCDHDFYIDGESPGFILYNLQLILSELQIPNYFCRIITQLPNYIKYSKLVQEKLTHDNFPILPITSIYSKLDVNNSKKIELNSLKISKAFSIGSRLSRPHRTYFMSQIFNNSLEKCGFINYYNINSSDDVTHNTNFTNNVSSNNCHFLSTIPFTRQNSLLRINKEKNREIFQNFSHSISSYSNCSTVDVIKSKCDSVKYQWIELQDSLVYVGLGSIVNCPESYHDEISFKGIEMKRPFILFGTPHLLSHLKLLGFKTFSNFWDESYDDIIDVEERVDAITHLLTELSNKTTEELQQLAIQMEPILEYNFNHLKNCLPTQELNKILQGLLRNVI